MLHRSIFSINIFLVLLYLLRKGLHKSYPQDPAFGLDMLGLVQMSFWQTISLSNLTHCNSISFFYEINPNKILIDAWLQKWCSINFSYIFGVAICVSKQKQNLNLCVVSKLRVCEGENSSPRVIEEKNYIPHHRYHG